MSVRALALSSAKSLAIAALMSLSAFGCATQRVEQRATTLVAKWDAKARHSMRLGAFHVQFALWKFGRAGSTHRVPPGLVSGTSERTEYRRNNIVERYEVRDRGVEQLFELVVRPPGEGPVELELAVLGDLRPRDAVAGQSIALVDRAERVVGTYDHLHVVDALGRSLPSTMHTVGGGITLTVDDSGAEYPILVDPFIARFEEVVGSSGARETDGFGAAVAISGEQMVVGAPFHSGDGAGGDRGMAVLFERTAAGWNQRIELVADARSSGDKYGSSVDIDDGIIVVGAPYSNSPADTRTGAAYVFQYRDGAWHFTKLYPLGGVSGERYGASVSVHGSRISIGAPGIERVYTWVASGTSWAREQTIDAPSFAPGDFGASVSVGDSDMVVGSPYAWGGAGRVTRFVLSAGIWTADVYWSGTQSGEHSGRSVALCADSVWFGAPDHDGEGVDAGRVEVAVLSSGSWSGLSYTLGPSGADSRFGTSVSCDGDHAIAGAPGHEASASRGGAAFLFSREAGEWGRARSIAPSSEIEFEDLFGVSVDVSADSVAVGRSGADSGWESRAGVVETSRIRETAPNGSACESDSDCTSSECWDGVCCATACGGGPSDCRACSVAAGSAVDGECRPRSAGTMCREGATCVASATCDGVSTVCPDTRATLNGTACDDGRICNGNELCRDGVCVSGSSNICADSNPCTNDICEEPTGMCYHPVFAACIDAGMSVPDASIATDAGELPDAASASSDAGSVSVEDAGMFDAGLPEVSEPDPHSGGAWGSSGCSATGNDAPTNRLAAMVALLALSLTLRWRRRCR